MANLTANLGINISNFAAGLRRAATMSDNFSNKLGGGIAKSLKSVSNNTKAWGMNIKSVNQVVSGILISQAFYRMSNAIQSSIGSVIEFNQELEYATMTYTNLFKSAPLAAEFINVLKDFAATTPFSFTESEAAAKRLLAYGVQYKNVMFVMQGILAASSAQNNPAIVENVSRALGQIYTKGRLMNEEMRQLAEAGIPAYEILREKLGLTQKQLQNLGREAIPANKAINALVEGMNERFGGVIEQSTQTFKGIMNNLVDNALMLGSTLMTPFMNSLKETVSVAGELLFTLRDISEVKGIGGVFEAIFPPYMHATMRTFAANLMVLWNSIKLNLAQIATFAGDVLYIAINIGNIVLPMLTIVSAVLRQVSEGLLYVTSAIRQNEQAMRTLIGLLTYATAMWILFKAKAMAAAVIATVCTVITKALQGVAFMLTIIAAHPIWFLIAVLTGTVIGLTGGFDRLGAAVQNFYSKLTAVQGVNPDKVFLPSQKSRANDLEKFNEKLADTGKGMKDLADSTGDATKAAKGLLNFDEVFKLKEDSGKDDDGIDDGGFDPGDLIPDFGDLIDGVIDGIDTGVGGGFGQLFPNVSQMVDNFVKNLTEDLVNKLKAAGLGALLGGLLGGILGGPLGAALGALAGSIVGYFWDQIAEWLGLTDVGTIALPIATMLGAIIGALIGGPAGALIGGAIGAFVGWLIDGFARGIETGDWTQFITGIVAGIGAALGFAFLGGPAGALLGGAIGAFVGHIIGMIVKGFTTGEWDIPNLAMSIASGLGAAIGFVTIGGPAGALLGASIGILVGTVISKISKAFTDHDWSSDGSVVAIGAGIGTAIGLMVGGPGGAIIGAGIGTLVGFIIDTLGEGLVNGNWDKIGLTVGSMLGVVIGNMVGGPAGALIGGAIGAVIGFVVDQFVTGFTTGDWNISAIGGGLGSMIGGAIGFCIGGPPGALIGAAVGALVGWIGGLIADNWDSITSWGTNIVDGIVEGIGNAYETVSTAISDFFDFFLETICKFFGIQSPATTMEPVGLNIILGLINGMVSGVGNVITFIGTLGSNVINSTGKWFDSIRSNVSTWSSETFKTISTWSSDSAKEITNWVGERNTDFEGWYVDTKGTIGAWAEETKISITNWKENTGLTISNWYTTGKDTIAKFATDAGLSISTWGTNTAGNVSAWYISTSTNVKTFVDNAGKQISDFATTSRSNIGGFVTDTISGVRNWSSEMISNATSAMRTFKREVSNGMSNALSEVSDFCSEALRDIRSWATDFGDKISSTISKAGTSLDKFATKAANMKVTIPTSTAKTMAGHASGGVFNREHIASFAEGNKAEAIIPLENNSAMQPFVDAVSNGIVQALAPIMVNVGSPQQDTRMPVYVHTLIADESGLTELNRRLNIISIKEERRGG